MRLLTYIIPCRLVTIEVIRRLELLSTDTESVSDPKFIVITGEPPESPFLDERFEILYEPGLAGFWEKVAYAGALDVNSKFVTLMADDDLNFVSRFDLDSNSDLRVGASRTVMIYPQPEKRFLIYEGWTHFFDVEGESFKRERISRLIGEGPVSVYSTYRSSYFSALAVFVSKMLHIKTEVQGSWNLIEDCINVVNLTLGVKPLHKSTTLRVLNSPGLNQRNIKLSFQILKEMELSERKQVCAWMRDLLICCDPESDCMFSEKDLHDLLVKHTIGYASANSRKWRSWLDVEFSPFENPNAGIKVPSKDRKYNPVFSWHGRASLSHHSFPPSSWISKPGVQKLIASIPDFYWKQIQF